MYLSGFNEFQKFWQNKLKNARFWPKMIIFADFRKKKLKKNVGENFN